MHNPITREHINKQTKNSRITAAFFFYLSQQKKWHKNIDLDCAIISVIKCVMQTTITLLSQPNKVALLNRTNIIVCNIFDLF